jgi:hypothetical protein
MLKAYSHDIMRGSEKKTITVFATSLDGAYTLIHEFARQQRCSVVGIYREHEIKEGVVIW